MTLADAVRLGRISNLPTVWTNVAAGIALAGGVVWDARTPLLMLAFSLAYVGGMYLNDAFDAEIDARQRRERPIPAGRVRRSTVFGAGFGLLAGAVVLLLAIGYMPASGTGAWPAVTGLVLAATIVLYDWQHKGNPIGPVLMGLCRALVYIGAGLAHSADLPGPLLAGALLLFSHIVGLTYLAKQEGLGRVANWWPVAFLAAPILFGIRLAIDEPSTWIFLAAFAALVTSAIALALRRLPGDIGKAVVLLLAGISLLDTLLIAGTGSAGLAIAAAAGFPLTLVLQRFVSGT
jgi:4-hydroxybenzoate polyprenyltransferase